MQFEVIIMSQQQEEMEDNKINERLETDDLSIPSEKSKEDSAESVLEAEIIDDRSFSERWKTNRFFLIRGAYYVIVSIWIVFMAVGGFIAWLIAMLFI